MARTKSKTKDPSQIYLRFVNLASAIRSLPTFPILDAMEERVLNGLAAVWATGGEVSVRNYVSERDQCVRALIAKEQGVEVAHQ